MEFIKEYEDKVVKYNITFNEKKLSKIMTEIIYNCGKREHVSYDTDYVFLQDSYYENYKQEAIGEKEYFEETRTVYHIEYDLIHKPTLAKLIEDLIKEGSIEIIDYLYGDKKIEDDDNLSFISKRKELLINLKKSIKDRFEKKTVDEIKKSDYEAVRDILKEIEDTDNQIRLNESLNLNQQINYIERIKKCISVDIVDEIDIEIYNRVNSFKTLEKKK